MTVQNTTRRSDETSLLVEAIIAKPPFERAAYDPKEDLDLLKTLALTTTGHTQALDKVVTMAQPQQEDAEVEVMIDETTEKTNGAADMTLTTRPAILLHLVVPRMSGASPCLSRRLKLSA